MLRRPGGWLVLLGTATILLLLPRIAARALDSGAPLAVELTISTVGLHLSLLGATFGAVIAPRSAELGLPPEFAATPLRPLEFAFGRLAGAAATLAVHAALLLVVGLLALATVPPATLLAIAVGVVLTLLQGVLALAVTAALAALTSPVVGLILGLVYVATSRALVPATLTTGSALAWFLPDLARLDVARALAFAQPIGSGPLVLAVASALLQITALTLLSGWAARRAAVDLGVDAA